MPTRRRLAIMSQTQLPRRPCNGRRRQQAQERPANKAARLVVGIGWPRVTACELGVRLRPEADVESYGRHIHATSDRESLGPTRARGDHVTAYERRSKRRGSRSDTNDAEVRCGRAFG